MRLINEYTMPIIMRTIIIMKINLNNTLKIAHMTDNSPIAINAITARINMTHPIIVDASLLSRLLAFKQI